MTAFVLSVGVSLFLIPWCSYKLGGYDINIYPQMLSIMAVLPFMLVKTSRWNKIPVEIAIPTVFLAWVIFRSQGLPWPAEAYSALRYYIFGLLAFGALAMFEFREKELVFLIWSLVAGCAMAAYLMITGAIDLDPNSKARLTAGEINGNHVAYCCTHAASLLAVTFGMRHRGTGATFQQILLTGSGLVFLFLGILLPQTRGAFIGFSLLSVLMLLGSRLPTWKIGLLVCMGGAALAGVLFLSPAFLERLAGDTGRDYGSARLIIWAMAWELFSNSPLTGIGVGQFGQMSFGIPVHNVFLSYLTELGLVGLLLFLGSLAGIFWKARQNAPAIIVWYYFAPWLIVAMTGAWERAYVSWVGFGILLAVCKSLALEVKIQDDRT